MKIHIALILSILAFASAVKFENQGLKYFQGFHFGFSNGDILIKHFDAPGIKFTAKITAGRKNGELIIPEEIETLAIEEIPFGEGSLYEFKYRSEAPNNGIKYEHIAVEIQRNGESVFFRAFPIFAAAKKNLKLGNVEESKQEGQFLVSWTRNISEKHEDLIAMKTCLNDSNLELPYNVYSNYLGFGQAKIAYNVVVDPSFLGDICKKVKLTIYDHEVEIYSKVFTFEDEEAQEKERLENVEEHKNEGKFNLGWTKKASEKHGELEVVKSCNNANLEQVSVEVTSNYLGFGEAKIAYGITVDNEFDGQSCDDVNIAVFEDGQEIFSKDYKFEGKRLERLEEVEVHKQDGSLSLGWTKKASEKHGDLVVVKSCNKANFDEQNIEVTSNYLGFGEAKVAYGFTVDTDFDGQFCDDIHVSVFEDGQEIYSEDLKIKSQSLAKKLNAEDIQETLSEDLITLSWTTKMSEKYQNLRAIVKCLNINTEDKEADVKTFALGFGAGNAKLSHSVVVTPEFGDQDCENVNVSIFDDDQLLYSKDY